VHNKNIMNYTYWKKHFRDNSLNRKEPEWDAPIHLEGKALRKLTRSIQQFQLGDGGGPAYLIAWDREKFLGQSPEIRALVDHWFKEEEEHSRLLGDLLKRFGAEEIESHWSFSVFCFVRKWLGVRFELNALLLTEIVSHVYYKMLHKHGDDIALHQMCRLIIRDEASHIRFHRARLKSEAEASGRTRYGFRWAMMFRLRGLAAGTMLWINHRSALVALGGSTPEFYRTIWRGMGRLISGVRRDLETAQAASRQIDDRPETASVC